MAVAGSGRVAAVAVTGSGRVAATAVAGSGQVAAVGRVLSERTALQE